MPNDFPLIPRFKDLDLICDSCTLDDLALRLSSALSNWSRNEVVEQRAAEFGTATDRFAVFHHPSDDEIGTPEVNLFIRATEEGFEVTNIVPAEAGSLEADQYNAILDDFRAAGLDTIADESGCRIAESSSVYDLREQLGPEAGRRLVRFSRAANRSTGSSHPADRARWMDFLDEAHRATVATSCASLLGEWLELDGWSDELATELAIQFEFAMELLNRVRAR